MRLEDVLPAYRAGKKIRRASWGNERSFYTTSNSDGEIIGIEYDDVEATDWLVIDDHITITREQFERAWLNMPVGGKWSDDDLWAELSK